MTLQFHGMSRKDVLEFLLKHADDIVSASLVLDVNGVNELSVKWSDGADITESDLPGIPVHDPETTPTTAPGKRRARTR